MDTQRLQYLFTQHDSGLITATEKMELYSWLSDYQNREDALHFFETTIQSTTLDNNLNTSNWQSIIDHILAGDKQPATVRTMWSWKRIAIAASIIATIGIAAYFIINPEPKGPAVVVSPLQQHDVPAPDKNRAQIKLSDGSIVYLDSAANGQLATQSNVIVTKTEDGKIVYSSLTTHDSPLTTSYNTLMNPRGSKVQPLTLSDGTKVWLNAESSITYPTAFVGNERKVTMTGEAYFEVAKDAKKKFIVDANGTSTEVLGTHFNINAYNDEQEIKVTLLEGSVNVLPRASARGKVIKPGEQAVVLNPANPSIPQIMVQTNVDLDQTMSWKNGYFNFNQESITTIMRELGRWYNTEIVFSGEKPIDKFSAIIKRSNNISQVLKMLEKTNRVHFTIEGTTITVKK